MTFRQLEENINKWTLELEDMEKQFTNQATQVNAWDQLLVKNGEKILNLNDAVNRVRQDQQRLEHELDFVSGQQAELEESLRPLELAMAGTTTVDTERERTYQLAENLDAQLKRMSEDLKEVISHLNLGSKGADTSDPVAQIAKILNAHMDSLQWVDQNASAIEKQLITVNRITELQTRDSDRLQRSFVE
jgi:nuclear pore complex protein Nup62